MGDVMRSILALGVSVFLFTTLLTVVGTSCVADTPCSCHDGGFVVDLSRITLPSTVSQPMFSDIPARPDDHSSYSYSPCVPFTKTRNDSRTSGCTGVNLCRKVKEAGIYYSLGDGGHVQFQGDVFSDQLSLVYDGFSIQEERSTVHLRCSPDEGRLEAQGKTDNGYEFMLYTKHACIPALQAAVNTADVSTTAAPTGQPASGLSPGSIILIIFLVCVAVYLIVGILYKIFVQGARGMEVFPNYEFWTDLPSLIRDGTVFCLSGCKGQQDTRYESI